MKTTTLPTAKVNGSVNQDKAILSIYETYDYDKFKLMSDNRNVNLLHIKRLVNSFKEHHLVCPVIVNEKFEVIDGQHRLHAAIETGMPVHYFIVQGYGIKEVTRLNTNQSDWKRLDYLKMYCSEGIKPYLQLNEFMQHFPDFKFQAAERICALKHNVNMRGEESGLRVKMNAFESGDFIVPDIKKSYSLARKLMDFKPYYKNFNRGTFVSAMMPLIIKSAIYNHKEMIHKLSTCPIKLTDCDKIEAYRLLIEDIYNYKRQKENKVSFRYE